MDENGGNRVPSTLSQRKNKLSPIDLITPALLLVSYVGNGIVSIFYGHSTSNGIHNPTLGMIEVVLGLLGAIGTAGFIVWPPSLPWKKKRQYRMVGFWLWVTSCLLLYCVGIASTVFEDFVTPPAFLQPFMGPYLPWIVLALVVFMNIAFAIYIIQLIIQAKSNLKTGLKSQEP